MLQAEVVGKPTMEETPQQKTQQATRKRILIGRVAEIEFLEHMKKHKGATAYEAGKALGWSNGKIQGVLKRIKDELRFEEVITNGRTRKEIYPIKVEEFLDKDVLNEFLNDKR